MICFDSEYFESKLKVLAHIEKELIEIWELLSPKEKTYEKQYQKFLTAQRAARHLHEAFLCFAQSQKLHLPNPGE